MPLHGEHRALIYKHGSKPKGVRGRHLFVVVTFLQVPGVPPFTHTNSAAAE